MAEFEMWDYLSPSTADSKTLIATPIPQQMLVEEGVKNVIIHTGDDGSEERIALDNDPIFRVNLQWDYLTGSDAGIIVNQYYSTGEGNGTARSWRWTHPTDGHNYTVRFDEPLSRAIMPRSGLDPTLHQISAMTLRILGRTT